MDSTYTRDEAVADGMLVAVFQNRWPQLSAGKPIVATAAVSQDLSLAALREIWNEYVLWRRTVLATLPEEARLFTTRMNERTVWVLEDGAAFTILYPEDY